LQPDHAEKRREPRFPVEVGANVKLRKNGQTTHATAVNVSGSGVLLRFEEPFQAGVGDQVICEFKVSDDPDPLLPYWVMGTVLRVTDCCAVVDLSGGAAPLLAEAQVSEMRKPVNGDRPQETKST
jgi:hypothetical protein